MSIFSKIRKYLDILDSNRVFIYQMGKVGSSSLEAGLAQSMHFHTCFANEPCHPAERRRSIDNGLLRNLVRKLGYIAKRSLIGSRSEVRIITVVRDPAKRSISMFFQNLPDWICHFYRINPSYDTRSEDQGFLFDVFEQAFDHDYSEAWFDREILRLTGIDVFETEYDFDSGYEILENGKYKVFVVRAEDMKRVEVLEAIACFARQDYSQVEVNAAERKWYAGLYRDFRLNFGVEVENISRRYNRRLFDKFYR